MQQQRALEALVLHYTYMIKQHMQIHAVGFPCTFPMLAVVVFIYFSA